MSNFENYKRLSKLLAFNYKGVELSHVTACQIWAAANGEKVFSMRGLFNFFLKYNVSSLKLPAENGFLSTFMESWRKDHHDLYMSVVDRLAVHPEVNELFNMRKKPSVHVVNIYKTLKNILKHLKSSELSLWERLNWAANYTLLCNTIDTLNKMDFSKVHKYLCMCHVLGLENLLTQYFRNKGITTYSLQEGIYLVYKKNIVLGSIAYELFATDHLLCWGQYTKDEYSAFGIEPSRVNVAGYPKCNIIKPLKKDNSFRKCLVMLASPIFGDVNMKLIQMLNAKRNEFNFTLKSHPVNYVEMEDYARSNNFNIVPKSKTVNDCLVSEEFDFCIAVNSTTYYESWMAGVPCVRYHDDRFDNFYGFDDLFSNEEQFKTMINGYRVCPKTEDEVKEMLKYSIGFGLDNYDKVINEDLQ